MGKSLCDQDVLEYLVIQAFCNVDLMFSPVAVTWIETAFGQSIVTYLMIIVFWISSCSLSLASEDLDVNLFCPLPFHHTLLTVLFMHLALKEIESHLF